MTGARSQARVVVAALTAAAVLGGCGSTPAGDRRGESPPAPKPPPVATGHNDHHALVPSPPREPTWDAASRRAAKTAAARVMRAFARPGMNADAWWADLSPLLSHAARHAYQGTDPAEVAAREVTGTPTLTDDSSAYLALVSVPTDTGAHLVLLSRAGHGEPWLAERITPASSTQRP